ncbi:MAG: hypothetical protein A2X59_07865 [Nitrospirae bacterium GWC2_42_7]|nr:MAG: hypothetical protein A2X59_07865 [Nitrospirae bacterium GWC2_42_7]
MQKEWVELIVTYDQLEAEMIKDLLESGDMDVVLRSSKISPYPVNVGKIGEVRVLVREEDKETAEEVLKQFREKDSNMEQ